VGDLDTLAVGLLDFVAVGDFVGVGAGVGQ
jgi:hypothetical protein